MKHVVFDTETDGFYREATEMHSLVVSDRDDKEMISCTDAGQAYHWHPIEHGLDILAKAEAIYAHNAIEHDIPVIKKLYPRWKTKARVIDTLVVSRTSFAHLKELDFGRHRKNPGFMPGNYIGNHGIEAWGYRLGLRKGDYQGGFEQWNQEMQEYCELDVRVNKVLLQYLRNAGFVPEVIETEHWLAQHLWWQHLNGFPLDLEHAATLQAELAGERDRITQQLVSQYGSWWKPGKLFTPKQDNKRWGYVKGAECQKIELVEFNPSSREHIMKVLRDRYGWVPTQFTDKGNPQLDDKVLRSLEGVPEAEQLLRYIMVDQRLGQMAEGQKAWLKLEVGGRLHHRCCHNGTVTHRGTHKDPNMNVPSVDAPYGKECRQIFTSFPGWWLVGADASGLELRCLGHYMARWDNGAFIKELLEGDIHTANQEAAGLPTRANAKTFIYAFLYGAGDEKIGSITNPNDPPEVQRRAGKRLKNRFLKNLPALRYLIDAVKKQARTKGYLRLIDNRRAYVRHQHAALNTLLQGTGSIVCKLWLRDSFREITEEFGRPVGALVEDGLDIDVAVAQSNWAAHVWAHDETQAGAATEEIGHQVGQILVRNIQAQTERLNFRCPLDGEYKIGKSWADTH